MYLIHIYVILDEFVLGNDGILLFAAGFYLINSLFKLYHTPVNNYIIPQANVCVCVCMYRKFDVNRVFYVVCL